MKIHGVIFDLDGTLVDSGLDFPQMRREMGLPAGMPILEGLAEIGPGERFNECLRILDRHEQEAAERATLMPGAGLGLPAIPPAQVNPLNAFYKRRPARAFSVAGRAATMTATWPLALHDASRRCWLDITVDDAPGAVILSSRVIETVIAALDPNQRLDRLDQPAARCHERGPVGPPRAPAPGRRRTLPRRLPAGYVPPDLSGHPLHQSTTGG